MQVTTHVDGDTFEARLSDRLSFSDNGAFRKLLDEMLASNTRHWVFDVANLAAVDSAGLGMFIIAMETAKKAGQSLVLRSPTGHVKNLIELSKMDKLITVEG